MKLSAITIDQVVILDGKAENIYQHGAGYTVPSGEWAIHFDSQSGIGQVEYLDARLNETISQVQFDERYAYLIDCHAQAKATRIAEEQAE